MIQVQKKEMAEELKQKIESWNSYSEFAYGYSIDDAKEFIKRFRIGIYDSGIKGIFWFGPRVDTDLLVCWDSDRRSSGNTFSNITEENLIAYAALRTIKDHITKIELFPAAYKEYNKTSLGEIQTPMTKEEHEQFDQLYNTVLTTNYNWRQAREIQKNFKLLNIYENKNFPHNIDEIKNCFNPTIKTIFPDYFEKGKCFFETIEFERKATTLANELTNENLIQMFKTPSTSYIEEYLRHAILSQFNLKKLLQQASKEEKDLVQQELLQSTTLSDKAIAFLFKDANLDDLLYLAKGVLQSLTSPKKIINIKDCCQKHEINLNSKNSSKLFLPNGDEIPPLPENRQEKKLIRFQKKYEFLYKNATDLEYVEGCTEILGDLLIAQIYDYANIEISKCLFNTLLISRGILPPVLNFNKNNQELLKDFIKGINNRSQSAIPKVLEEVITQTEQLKHKKYNKPTII